MLSLIHSPICLGDNLEMPETQATILVKVQPNARRNEIVGFGDGTLRVKISAPPVEGKANKALIAFLSEILGVRKSNIGIEKGETSKRKRIVVEGMTQSEILERLLKL